MNQGIYCLALGLLLAAEPASAQGEGPDITGSWKESSRLSPGGTRTAYTDTTYYDFLIGNEYTTQRRKSYMYRGTYKITPVALDLGMRRFSILEMGPDRMRLKDDAGSYEFVRYDKSAANAENSSAATSSDRGHKEEISGSRVTPMQLAGKWEVYKRTSSTTLKEVDYNRIVKVLEIRPEGRQLGGNIYAANDGAGKPSWKIVRYEDGILYGSGERGVRQLKVLRYSDGELIVQEDNLTYFFKQFK